MLRRCGKLFSWYTRILHNAWPDLQLADFLQLLRQDFFTTNSRGKVAEKFSAKKVAKYPMNLSDWQTFCSCDQRRRTFAKSGTIKALYIRIKFVFFYFSSGQFYSAQFLVKMLHIQANQVYGM